MGADWARALDGGDGGDMCVHVCVRACACVCACVCVLWLQCRLGLLSEGGAQSDGAWAWREGGKVDVACK